jgi:hypothetical protein
MVAAMNFASVTTCTAIAACTIILGTACMAVGWWAASPANLPGDEIFNIERAVGLTVRSLVGWPQPPDAPAVPGLVTTGIGIDIGGFLIVAAGLLLRFFRSTIDGALAARARDVRLVVLDDEPAAAVAAEPTPWTNVLIGDASLVKPALHAVHVQLDDDLISGTLPRIAVYTRELLALGLDASANIDLARRMIALRRTAVPSQPLDRLWIRIDPRELRTSIGRECFWEFEDAAGEIRLTSLPEARCRCLLRDQPPNKVRLVGCAGQATIVVVGLGETGLELLARLCAQAQSPNYDPLIIVLVDTEAPAVAHELGELWPALSLVAEIRTLALEPRLPQSAVSLFRHLHGENLVPSCLYIALEDPALCEAWESEIHLAVRLVGRDSPLVLTVGQGAASDRSVFSEEEEIALLQQQLHADYLQRSHESASGATAAAVPGSRLPFDYQEDNRSVADHLWAKARDFDLRIVPAFQDVSAIKGDSALQDCMVSFDDSMVEKMAAAEHRRWIASRAIAGWRYGDSHYEAERTHPSLVPWAQLSESERDKDRLIIRRIGVVLRTAGLSLQPLVGFSVPRAGITDASADALVTEALARTRSATGSAPHLIVGIEDSRSLKLARRLTQFPTVAVSLVVAQPLSGLAAAAGVSSYDASQMEKAAHTLWITRPEAFDATLAHWPALDGRTS